MNSPFISIIVPIYNVEKYLNDCIKSILTQIFYDFELILSNDGSTDKSLDICMVYLQKDKRIILINNTHRGVSYARNCGINVARGRYIVFVDSDDIVNKDWCYELLKLVKYENSMIMNGYTMNYTRYGRNLKIITKFSESEEISVIKKKDFYLTYEKSLFNYVWNKIYSAEIIKENNIYFKEGINLGEDIMFNLEYLEFMNNKIIILNKSLYVYQLRDNESLDNMYYDNLVEIYNDLYQKLYYYINKFKGSMEQYEEMFYTSYLNMLIRALHNTFNSKNKDSIVKKIKINSKILKSGEFIKCIGKCDKKRIGKWQLLCLSSGNYMLVIFHNKLVELRNYIFKYIK